jgi:hypothetical protein
MTLLLIVLLALAAHRITRLLTRDKLPFIDIPRDRFVNRWGVYDGVGRIKDDVRRNALVRAFRWFWANEFPAIDGAHRTNLVMKSLAYLWECDWCMGVWVSGALVWVTNYYVEVPYPFLVWPAIASITGLIASYEGVIDKKAE